MVRRIGRGSYGEVWLARNAVGTWRAVKVVHRDRFNDSRPYEREFSGIKKYEPISRANEGLVDVLQIGRNDDEGYFYYVMELAGPQNAERGTGEAALAYKPRTLASEIKARGHLPVDECVSLGITLCLALGHLHRSGLIHRDVKPSNIIFVSGVPKLADIGLVTDFADARSFVGTEGFIPPEGPNSPQADLYALGKVLYEASMGKDRHDFPEPLTAGLDSCTEAEGLMELNEVLLRACAPNTKERYKSAEQMIADLALLHSGESVHQKRQLERRIRFLSRAGMIMAAVVLLGAIPYYLAIKEALIARSALSEKAAQAQRADGEASRARAAEADAKEKLWQSLLNEAQARRWSGRVGRRFDSLAAIKKAAAIRPCLELRNEAIACLVLPDLRLEKVWGKADGGAQILGFDGKYERYVFLHTNGLVSIRRTMDDAEILNIPGLEHPEPGYGPMARFSADGRFLAVASGARIRQVEVWDLPQKQRVESFGGRFCRDFAFAPDRTSLAIAFVEGEDERHPIVIYDPVERRVITCFEAGLLPQSLSFRPLSNQLAISSSWTNEVLVFNLADGRVAERLPHPHFVFDIDWSPDGTTIATGCDDANVYLWDLSGRADSGQRVQVIAAHERAVHQISFSQDGAFLVSAGEDGYVRFWNPRTRQRLLELQGGLTQGFSQEGYRLALRQGRDDRRILELDVAKECRTIGTGLLPRGATVRRCDISPSGELLLSAHEDGLRIWNLATGMALGFQPEEDVQFALFEPCFKRCLSLSPRHGVKEWDLHPEPQGPGAKFGLRRLLAKPGPLELAISSDGSLAAVADLGGVLALSLNDDGRVVFREASTHLMRPVFAPDGKLAVSVAAADTLPIPPTPPVKIFDPLTKTLVTEFPHHAGGRLLFSPDGKWLMVGDNLEYCLRDTQHWEVQGKTPTSRARPGIISFTPDSSKIAIALDQDTVQLMETTSGRELATLRAPELHEISGLQFTPDGNRLVVSYVSSQVDVWDLALLRQGLATMNLEW
jgi:WD40 repeat protein